LQRIIRIALLATAVMWLSGCGDNNKPVSVPTGTIVEHQEETASPQPSDVVFHPADWNGQYYDGDLALTIEAEEDSAISGSFYYPNHNESKVAEASFSGQVQNGKLSFSFSGDGYGTEGTSYGEVTFKEDYIQMSLTIEENRMGWSLPSGQFTLRREAAPEATLNEQNEGLSADQALELRKQGVTAFLTLFHDGGNSCSVSMNDRVADDSYYYFFCEDADTKEKLKETLLAVFSERITSEVLDTYPIKEVGGKLAYQPYDVGSTLEWEQAAGTVQAGEELRAVAEFQIPDLDGEQSHIVVEYVYEQGGWKIDSSPGSLK